MPLNASNYLSYPFPEFRCEAPNSEPSLTVPGLALSVAEIAELQRLGRPMDGLVRVRQESFDEDSPDLGLPLGFERLSTLDKMDAIRDSLAEVKTRVRRGLVPDVDPVIADSKSDKASSPGDVVDGG